MTMSLYKKLEETLLSIAKDDDRFLKNHLADLTHYDREIILNDARPGDTFISVLKASGSGTSLLLCHANRQGTVDYNKSLMPDDGSKYFKLKLTGIDEGDIQEITRDEALKLVDTVNPTTNVQRRYSIGGYLHKLLAGDDYPTYLRSSIDDNLKTKQGYMYVLKLSNNLRNNWIDIEAIRTKGAVEDNELGRDFKGKVPCAFDITYSFHQNNDGKPKFYKVKCVNESEAVFEEVSGKVYDNAVKKLKREYEESLSIPR